MINPLHDVFIQEAEDNLSLLEGIVISMEEDPSDETTINEAFRSIHSIKGGAGLAGFPGIKDFTHIMEDLLEIIRNGSIKIDESHISVILRSLDIVKLMINNIKLGNDSNDGLDPQPLVREITAIIQKTEVGVNSSDKNEVVEDGIAPNEKQFYYLKLLYYPEIFVSGIDPFMFLSDLKAKGEILSIKTYRSAFPEIENFDPEKFYLSWELFYHSELSDKEILDIFCFVVDESEISVANLSALSEQPEVLSEFTVNENTIYEVIPSLDEKKGMKNSLERRSDDRRKGNRRSAKRTDGVASSFIRVQTEKLENIFNTVSELLISQARLNMLTEEHEEEIPDSFSTVTDSLKNITTILQVQITSLRMTAIGSTFDRFKRVVRDVASERGKKVRLHLSGQDTELDKNMIERLNDPLKHLVRNCIDHGIETQNERLAAGKPDEGNLHLLAYIENGKVIIEISDDGAGINRQKILEKALDKGIILPEQQLSDGEIMNLIFHPGLSTADKITDLSGRGVGMDVVRSSIMELHGNIEIKSKEGKGTTFKLHLPLTLAILDGMLINVGVEKYIIPTLSILEIFRPEKEHLKTISGKREVVFFRGEYIPLIRLYNVFDIKEKIEEATEAELIVVYSGGMKSAILVDNVMEQFQIVLKSLQNNFRKVENISSATILGNGDVALIIDIQNLLQQSSKGRSG